MSTSPPADGRHGVAATVVRGCPGDPVEWYDWFVHASFSTYFATIVFPKRDLTARLLSTAVVFAVGFLVRPLGGPAGRGPAAAGAVGVVARGPHLDDPPALPDAQTVAAAAGEPLLHRPHLGTTR